jgi:hypothetical protein
MPVFLASSKWRHLGPTSLPPEWCHVFVYILEELTNPSSTLSIFCLCLAMQQKIFKCSPMPSGAVFTNLSSSRLMNETNKLECSSLASFSSPGKCLLVSPERPLQGRFVAVPANITQGFKKLFWDKHSSFFGPAVSYKERHYEFGPWVLALVYFGYSNWLFL